MCMSRCNKEDVQKALLQLVENKAEDGEPWLPFVIPHSGFSAQSSSETCYKQLQDWDFFFFYQSWHIEAW